MSTVDRDGRRTIRQSPDGAVRFSDPGLLMNRVTDALRDAIISGRLKPGERIRERELVATLGISRSPLREAIRILEAEGLITSLPHRGSRVSELTGVDFREINEARIMVETFAARLAVERLDDSLVAGLEASVDEARRAQPDLHAAQDFRLALRFHDEIVKACGNARIVQLYEFLKGHLLRYHHVAVSRLGRDLHAIEEHAALIEALRRRDIREFERQLARHLRRVTTELAPLFLASLGADAASQPVQPLSPLAPRAPTPETVQSRRRPPANDVVGGLTTEEDRDEA
ncbi:MAG: GntR family transcriptional regulator [Candidatus Rokuibacteriota bacterium]